MSPSLPRPSRRSFLLGAGGAALAASVGVPLLSPSSAVAAETLGQNPLVRQRADPSIARHSGSYYMTASVPEYDRLVVRGAPTIGGLSTAGETTIWTRPRSGELGGHIWAPELHRIDGRWYMYFAAGTSADRFRVRMYVIESSSSDPRARTWSAPRRIHTAWDTFSLDATTFSHRGSRYYVWAQSEPGIATNSNLYISRMSSPTTLTGPQTRIAVPTASWETRGYKVNEGPAVIIRNGRVFIAFSASATDANYCLGLLTASDTADLLNAGSWRKTGPVFTSNAGTSQYGPGHNQFTTSPAGADLLVYHAREYRDISGNPLYDPNRHTRVQKLNWNSDGTPNFGVPVANGPIVV